MADGTDETTNGPRSSGIAFSADGRHVASAITFAGPYVWDVRTRSWSRLSTVSEDADDLAVALDAEGRLLAVGG